MKQKRITEIFAEKEKTFSVEFFPPKTEKGYANLIRTAGAFADIGVDFFSVTYGAGGSTQKGTLELVRTLSKKYRIPVMHHFTCVTHTFDQIHHELKVLKNAGIKNIMALRGDLPEGQKEYRGGPDRPHYGFELVKEIRRFGDWFSIGVAGFPEMHPRSKDANEDSMTVKIKEESGADFVVTQLFFDNNVYSAYAKRLQEAQVGLRIIPGILPVTNYPGLLKFLKNTLVKLPDNVTGLFEPLAEDLEATTKAGTAFCLEQGRDLIKRGAPGIHFYCLNKAEPCASIIQDLMRS